METVLILIVCINILLGVFVLLQSPKSQSSVLFTLMSFLSSIWTFANFMIHHSIIQFWVASSYALGALVICSGLMWTILITKNNLTRRKIVIITAIAVFFFFLSYKANFIPPYFAYLATNSISNTNLDWGLVLYSIFYIITSLIILFSLYFSYKNANLNEEVTKKYQLQYIFIGALITLVTTAINSFIFPILSIYLSKGIDSLGFFFFLLLVTYAISKHELFKIRVIAIELVLFVLLVFLLARAFLSTNTQDAFTNIIIFFLILIIGFLLIQNIHQGIKLRRDIEKLTLDIKKMHEQDDS